MLTKAGDFNDLSDQLGQLLTDKIAKLGKKVKFKFNISQKNPEHNFQGAQNGDGEDVEFISAVGPKRIFPSYWDLQPVTFRIVDPGDKRRKRIGLVKDLNDEGNPIGFRRITLMERDRGIRIFDPEKPDDLDDIAYLLLHPALKGGLFHDSQYGDLFEIVDDKADARTRNRNRSDKADVMYVASNMNLKEKKDFACAMGWDENEEEDILADRIMDMAENDHMAFKHFMEHAHFNYRAAITRAEKSGDIVWMPLENKYTWANGQTIAAFGMVDNLDRLKALAEFLQTHKEGDAMFKRIKSLVSNKKEKEPVE
jgi:hypothetical protein